MLFHVQPDLPWEPFDFKLLEAYQILQDETCPKCGQPTWLCRNDDPRVQFKYRDVVCYATRAVEEKRANQGKGKKSITKEERASWGRIEFAVPFVPDNVGGELPTRAEYFERLNSEVEMVD